MIQKAAMFGSDMLATGHYAKVVVAEDGSPRLFGSTDELKDQSYFLSCVKKEAFGKAMFPLSDLTKMKSEKLHLIMALFRLFQRKARISALSRVGIVISWKPSLVFPQSPGKL